MGRVKVTKEDDNRRNIYFQDTKTGQNMTLNQFVRKIENGEYPNYHIREINDVKTPCSNPDKSEKNNLG
jgi:hypothetical protein